LIDQNGKKIVPDNTDEDPIFVLKEIAFLQKGFEKGPHDQLAYLLTKRVHVYLQLRSGGANRVKAAVELLRTYYPESKSTDFLWELVYVFRLLAKVEDGLFGSKQEVTEHLLNSARCFDRIIEVSPTIHNRCCLVIEYSFAVMHYGRQRGARREKLLELIGHMRDVFYDMPAYEQIPESYKNVYVMAKSALEKVETIWMS